MHLEGRTAEKGQFGEHWRLNQASPAGTSTHLTCDAIHSRWHPAVITRMATRRPRRELRAVPLHLPRRINHAAVFLDDADCAAYRPAACRHGATSPKRSMTSCKQRRRQGEQTKSAGFDAGQIERLSWRRESHQQVPRLDGIAASCSSLDRDATRTEGMLGKRQAGARGTQRFGQTVESCSFQRPISSSPICPASAECWTSFVGASLRRSRVHRGLLFSLQRVRSGRRGPQEFQAARRKSAVAGLDLYVRHPAGGAARGFDVSERYKPVACVPEWRRQ